MRPSTAAAKTTSHILSTVANSNTHDSSAHYIRMAEETTEDIMSMRHRMGGPGSDRDYGEAILASPPQPSPALSSPLKASATATAQTMHDSDDNEEIEERGEGRESGGRSGAPGCPCGVRRGNTIVLYEADKSAVSFPRVALVGPDYPCLTVTYALILTPSLAFLILVAPVLHVGVLVGGVAFLLAALAALSLTACSNPGYLRRQSRSELEAQRRGLEESGVSGTYTVCQFCNVIREPQTSHCYDCNLCVLELDHHCPWTGKCIGKHNLVYFYAFLACVFGLIIYTAACMFAWIISKATD